MTARDTASGSRPLPAQPSEAVEEWLRIHRQLLELENAFTDLAIRAVSGEVPLAELDERRAELMATRNDCTAAYRRAFPGASGSRRSA